MFKNNMVLNVSLIEIIVIVVFTMCLTVQGKESNPANHEEGKKEAGTFEERIEDEFEYELSVDEKLKNQVEDFLSPSNVLKLFHEHKEELERFAEECYRNERKRDSFFVKHIGEKRFYFCQSDAAWKWDAEKHTAGEAIENGYIISFMDYAVNNSLTFCDWMFRIDMPGLEEEGASRFIPLLNITIYKSQSLEIIYQYSPYKDEDYSEEFVVAGNCGGATIDIKTVRIDRNWYYKYIVTEDNLFWRPDLRILGFPDEMCADGKITAGTELFLTENLRGFLRLYWKYGFDFTKIDWWDWEEFRWTKRYEPEYDIP